MPIFNVNTRKLLVLLPLTSLLACGNPKPLPSLPESYAKKQGSLLYKAVEEQNTQGALLLKEGGIKARIALEANPQTGHCRLLVSLKNNTGAALNIPYQQWQLETASMVRNSPEYTDAFPSKLEDGDTSTYILTYQPINNRKLFSQLQLRGDFSPQYTWKWEQQKIEVPLKASTADYAAYLEKDAIERHIQPVKPIVSDQWQQDQEAYVQEEFPNKTAFMSFHDAEWNVQGIVMRYNAYILKDSLYIGYRAANQSEGQLRVFEEDFQLFLSGQPVKPSAVKPLSRLPKAPDGKGSILRKSNRYQANFTYALPKKSVGNMTFQVGLRWLNPAGNLLKKPIQLQYND